MAQETAPEEDQPEIVESVDSVVEEIETRREREEERHERKMNEIEEREEEMLESLFEEADLPGIEERHTELIEQAKEVKSIRANVRDRIFEVVSEHLSGGYPDVGGYKGGITVKNGRVHKYNKRKNSKVGFNGLVDGGYRDALEEALQQDAPDVADEIIHALDTIRRLSDALRPSWSSEKTIEPVTWVDTSRYRDEEHEFDTLSVRYSSKWSQYDGYGYIKLSADESRHSRSKQKLDPTDRDPKTIKLLGQARDELPPLLDDAERKIMDTRETWVKIRQRVNEDLPDTEE